MGGQINWQEEKTTRDMRDGRVNGSTHTVCKNGEAVFIKWIKGWIKGGGISGVEAEGTEVALGAGESNKRLMMGV